MKDAFKSKRKNSPGRSGRRWALALSYLLLACTSPSLAEETAGNSRSNSAIKRDELLAKFDASIRDAMDKETDAGTRELMSEWRYLADPSRTYFAIPTWKTEAPRYDVLRELRKKTAEQLVDAARHAAAGDEAAESYQLACDTLLLWPEHELARRWIGWTSAKEQTPHVQRGRRPHRKYRWPAGKYVLITSDRFHISTDCNVETGMQLAAELERLRAVWEQLFFDSWTGGPSFTARIRTAGTSQRRRRARHQIVLFQSQEQYLAVLKQLEPLAAKTKGYYHPSTRTAYFYLREKNNIPTWYHEATHQLFHEATRRSRDVGKRSDFWIVEGVAMYLESLQPCRNWHCTGGIEAERLQFARFRGLREGYVIPSEQLTAMGQIEVQRHARIGAVYSQAAGLTHSLMHGQNQRHRRALIGYIRDVYQGNRKRKDLSMRLGRSFDELDRHYLRFLRVNDEQLQRLDPHVTLRKLCLGNCPVTDQGLESLTNVKLLDWLDLAGTSVGDNGTRFLNQAVSLRQVTLEGTKITDLAVARLAAAQDLRQLDLSKTRTTDEAMATLAGLSRLESLWLTDTQVTDRGLQQLDTLQNLRLIDVSSTAATNDGIRKLKEKLPELKLAP